MKLGGNSWPSGGNRENVGGDINKGPDIGDNDLLTITESVLLLLLLLLLLTRLTKPRSISATRRSISLEISFDFYDDRWQIVALNGMVKLSFPIPIRSLLEYKRDILLFLKSRYRNHNYSILHCLSVCLMKMPIKNHLLALTTSRWTKAIRLDTIGSEILNGQLFLFWPIWDRSLLRETTITSPSGQCRTGVCLTNMWMSILNYLLTTSKSNV